MKHDPKTSTQRKPPKTPKRLWSPEKLAGEWRPPGQRLFREIDPVPAAVRRDRRQLPLWPESPSPATPDAHDPARK